MTFSYGFYTKTDTDLSSHVRSCCSS